MERPHFCDSPKEGLMANKLFLERSGVSEYELIELLREVKEVLDENKVEFWLECGTLLGAVREGKFLAWEHDIDLAAWQEGVSDCTKAAVSRELIDKGLKVQVLESYMSIRTGQVHADINFYRSDKDKAVVPLLIPKNLPGKYLWLLRTILLNPYFYDADFGNKLSRSIRSILILVSRVLPFFLRKPIATILSVIFKKFGARNISWIVPAHYFTDLASMKFYDMEFKVPSQKEQYLAYRYGDDWRIPRKQWSGYEQDGAIVKS